MLPKKLETHSSTVLLFQRVSVFPLMKVSPLDSHHNTVRVEFISSIDNGIHFLATAYPNLKVNAYDIRDDGERDHVCLCVCNLCIYAFVSLTYTKDINLVI